MATQRRAEKSHVLSKSNGSFRRLLDALGDVDTLTLFVGAGASQDSGLPNWENLVRTFLQNGFLDAQRIGAISDDRGYKELTEEIMSSGDLIAAATIGRFLHGEEGRDEAIKRALYLGQRRRPVAGRIVGAIGVMADWMREGLTIITTNYDDLIEHEIAQMLGETPKTLVVTANGIQTVVEGTIGIEIYHLHGFAPFHGQIAGPLVLDESDFVLSPSRAPGRVLPELLTNGPTLFIGTSMTDPTVVGACHVARNEGWSHKDLKWFGLFIGIASGFSQAAQTLTKKRLVTMGLEPVDLVSYGQVSQILFELIDRADLGPDGYWDDEKRRRYGHRFEDWRAALEVRYPDAQGGDRFGGQQKTLHKALSRAIVDICSDFDIDTGPTHGVALHLWVRRPDPESLGSLELWATSAQRYREAWSLTVDRKQIEFGAEHQAVKVVFEGSSRHKVSSADPTDRWQGIIAVPIDLLVPPYANLLVGAITLSSMKSLDPLFVPIESEVLQRLFDIGTELLDPSGPLDRLKARFKQ